MNLNLFNSCRASSCNIRWENSRWTQFMQSKGVHMCNYLGPNNAKWCYWLCRHGTRTPCVTQCRSIYWTPLLLYFSNTIQDWAISGKKVLCNLEANLTWMYKIEYNMQKAILFHTAQLMSRLSLQRLLRWKATGEKGPATELEPRTYTLSRRFSHELLVPVANPSSPIALCTTRHAWDRGS